MPRYDYQCPKCGTVYYDVKLEVKNIDCNIFCQKCNEIMKRKVSKTSFILKGQRWSKDGYSGGNST